MRIILVLAFALLPWPAAAQPAPPKPTIVLVHGAFAEGSSWDRVTTSLQSQGFNVVAVHQPLSSLPDDVDAVRRTIRAQQNDVILVGHSYGGMIITDAGVDEKVKGLVYVAAFAPDAGESIDDLGKGKPQAPWISTVVYDTGKFGALPFASITKFFAPDLPRAEQALIAAKQGPIAARAFADKAKNAAWKSKPVWYIRASQDRMIDPKAQQAMAQRIKAKVTDVESSHVPMLSKPQAVTAVIVEAARDYKTARPVTGSR